jgi:hypothetical protein
MFVRISMEGEHIRRGKGQTRGMLIDLSALFSLYSINRLKLTPHLVNRKGPTYGKQLTFGYSACWMGPCRVKRMKRFGIFLAKKKYMK